MSIADLQKAARTKDVELAMSTLADDVVVRSPLTDQFTFNGKDDVRRLFEAAYENFDGLHYHSVIGDRVLVGGATANGQPLASLGRPPHHHRPPRPAHPPRGVPRRPGPLLGDLAVQAGSTAGTTMKTSST
jgi:ketosteroid isomerase-like protein